MTYTHESQIAELKAKINSLQEQVNAADCQITDLIDSKMELKEQLAKAEGRNKVLEDALNVCLGHLTGGTDGDWRDCDPRELARKVLSDTAGSEGQGG